MTTAIARAPGAPLTKVPEQTQLIAVASGGGDGEPVMGLAKMDPGNGSAILAIKNDVPLSESRGELWKFRGALTLTALGYQKLNQFIGVSFIDTDTVSGDDGKPCANPYYRRDPQTGEMLGIRQRKIGTWINATGNRVVYALTLDYDLQTHFAQDLYSKWAPTRGGKSRDGKPYSPKPSKKWGRLVGTLEGEEVKGTEKAYLLPGGMHLIVDLTDADVQACIGEHLNRQRFAGRLADTICQRNILKKATATTTVGPSGRVPVVSSERSVRHGWWHQRQHKAAHDSRGAGEGAEGKAGGGSSRRGDASRTRNPRTVRSRSRADRSGHA
jgi:hypothetical protein